ncbi:hypothetical protein K1X84_12895 [bacterium]|nr:hypothetical protein [bacterium]
MQRKYGIFIRLPYTLKMREKKWYLASCEAIDVHSQGETKEKAIKNLREAVEGFLISCLERNVLDEVLKQSGFNRIDQNVVKENALELPIPLTHYNSFQECHA